MKTLQRRVEKLEQTTSPETVELFGVVMTQAAVTKTIKDMQSARSTLPVVKEIHHETA